MWTHPGTSFHKQGMSLSQGVQEGEKQIETEGEKNQCHDSPDTKKDSRGAFLKINITFVFTHLP